MPQHALLKLQIIALFTAPQSSRLC